MVFFTCQHCGSSLKKNAVEKHYMTECRNRNPNLTCVDCLKDFLGDAYVAHTSCLTEDEKYSAKGFKSKPPSDKGAKKQVSWMSSIQEIKIPPSMSAFQKKVINRCQNSPNVPQKRLKFQNFCKSLFGKFADINQVDEVFDLFEKVHKKSVDDSNIANSASNANSSGESKGTNDTKCQMNGESVGEGVKTQNSETNADEDGDVKMENGIEGSNKGQKLSKKERKELKRKEKLAAKLNEKSDQDNMELESSDVLENCENENTENEINNESPTKNDSSMDEDAQCNGEVEETDKHLSKKEKKKLKKQERFQAQLNEIEQTQKNDDMENGEVLDDKTHKKKKRRAEVNGVFENGKENKKSKKRSREDCGMDIDEEQVVKKSKDNDTHENGNLDAAETNSNGKSQFDWGDIIVQVLQSRKDKELPIKRLAKKVITEYQTNYATYETFEKISAKFHKKLKKIPGVKVLHDKAKLVVADE